MVAPDVSPHQALPHQRAGEFPGMVRASPSPGGGGRDAGMRASVSSNLIFGVGGGFWREKQFRLVTSTATALATILELTLSRLRLGLRRMICQFWKHRTRLAA